MPDVQGEKTLNELEAAEIIGHNNLISQTQLDVAVKIAQDVSSAGLHKSVNQVIVEKGYLTQGVLNSVLHQLGKSLAEVDKYEILAKLG